MIQTASLARTAGGQHTLLSIEVLIVRCEPGELGLVIRERSLLLSVLLLAPADWVVLCTELADLARRYETRLYSIFYPILSWAESHHVVDGVILCELWSIRVISVCYKNLVPGVITPLPSLAWPGVLCLTRVMSRRGQDEEMFTFVSAICSTNRLCSGSHPVSGFEDNTAQSNLANYFNKASMALNQLKQCSS